MRSGGRRIDFSGLTRTGTMLSEGEAGLPADALNALPARDPTAVAETVAIEILQAPLSEPVRRRLGSWRRASVPAPKRASRPDRWAGASHSRLINY